MKSLTRRQINEKIFHDKWAKSISSRDFFYKETFESPTAIENHFILSQMGKLTGKKILDLGCGVGDASIYFAKKGADVKAIDISPKMVSFLKKFAKKEKVGRKIHSMVMPAETLLFSQSTFDYVYGYGVLHHVDFLKTASEIKRVLKKGAYGYFIEPLAYNPVIEVYRKMASQVRTDDEKPLSLADIKKFSSFFQTSSHNEFHLCTLLIFIWFYFGKKTHPNQERYWKKLLVEGYRYKRVFNILNNIDKILLQVFPFLSRFCWTTVIIVQK